MSRAAFRRELAWLTRQPPSVLLAYLDALTWLDLEPAMFLTLERAVLRRLEGRA